MSAETPDRALRRGLAGRVAGWFVRQSRSGTPAGRDFSSFRLLDALKEHGCPVCRLVDEAVNSRLAGLFRELVNDPPQRERLRRSMGFCRRHSTRVLQVADALGLAILYQDLVTLAHRRLELLATGSRTSPRSPCPECEQETADTARYGAALAAFLEEPGMRQAYADSAGLCVLHLETVMAHASPTVRTFLGKTEGARLSALAGELAEFIRKADYRYAGEGLGDESDAPRRAVHRLSGARRPEP